MNRNDLFRGFQEIDDKLLERSEMKKVKVGYVWKKYVVLAACFCLLVIGATSIYNKFQNEGGFSKPQIVHFVNSVVETNAGTLTYHTDNFNDYTMKFTLEKKNDLEMYISFGGCIITKEWTDNDGTHQEVEEYIAISPYSDYEQQPEKTIIKDALVITVDGVETNEFPLEQGVYEISVYYGELKNYLDVIYTDVEILGFGHFKINCEGFEENSSQRNL